MFDEKKLKEVFGESDEGFRQNFDSVIAELQSGAALTENPARPARPARSAPPAPPAPRRNESKLLTAVSLALAACFILAVPALMLNRIFFDRNDFAESAAYMQFAPYQIEGMEILD